MLALGLHMSYAWNPKGNRKPIKGKNKDNNNEDRYVTTAPSYDAKLRPNDKVLVLAKSDMELVCPIELGKTVLEGISDDVGYKRPPHRDTSPSYNHQPDVSVPITVEETLPAKSDGKNEKTSGEEESRVVSDDSSHMTSHLVSSNDIKPLVKNTSDHIYNIPGDVKNDTLTPTSPIISTDDFKNSALIAATNGKGGNNNPNL